MSLLDWFRGPINVVDGVELPAPDDARWVGVQVELEHESILFRRQWKEDHLVLRLGNVYVIDDGPDSSIVCVGGSELEDGERYARAVIRAWRRRNASEVVS